MSAAVAPSAPMTTTVSAGAGAGAAGAAARPHKQSMSELKLRRLTEHNQRLRDDLDRPRVKVSEASAGLISYCKNTRDVLVPSVWGQLEKKDDPYAPQGPAGCQCLVQ